MAAENSTTIAGVIEHYQRSIERCQDDESRLLHCINKLYKLPIKVEHLQETGIGITVNSLRKFNGEIGVAARALVTKWKAMVAAKEEPLETTCQSNEDESNLSGGDEDRNDHNRKNTNREGRDEQREHDQKHSRKSSNDKEKDKHKSREMKDSTGTSSKHTSSGGGGTHHNEKSTTSAQETSSSKHKADKRENEKHQKSRDRAEKSDRKELDKERERSEKRKDDKKEVKETEKKSTSSSSHHHHKSSSSSSKRKVESSNGSDQHSTKDNENRKHRESEKEKHHASKKLKDEKHDSGKSSKDKEHREKPKPSSSASSSKPSTSAAAAAAASTNSERKRRRDSDESDDSKSPEVKAIKVQKDTENNKKNGEEIDGIDSTMGANFADVLGMLNMPTKKSKKSQQNTAKSPSVVSAAATSSTSKIASHSKESPLKSVTSTSKVNGVRHAPSSTRYSPDAKPDLLSSFAKLEPLDPSIALELPTISTNYKPMPLNQTVMDCVFNNSSAPRAPVRTLTDAEAFGHGISSKTMRTKIYSGVKTGQIHQVPSLFDLCIRVLQKNIDALEYTGGVPFEVLRPVIERATPQQLLLFEEYNPYLMEDCDVLWQQHVQRNYRIQKRQEMESWREMFLRCQEDQERKLSILAESIKQSQKIIAAPIRKTQLAFVDSMVKPPRSVQRKQDQYGTKSKLIATPAARVAALSSVTPNAAKTGDIRLRVAPSVRDAAQVSHSSIRPKKAPLMAKTLQFMRGRHKR